MHINNRRKTVARGLYRQTRKLFQETFGSLKTGKEVIQTQFFSLKQNPVGLSDLPGLLKTFVMKVERGEWLKGKIGSDANAWKGDGAKYCAKHQWIYRNFGKASKCENCFIEGKRKYEWANISGTYKRERSDYKEMCPSCHRKMDFSRSGRCRKGHLLTDENTYHRKDGNKACRKCGREATKKYHLKKLKLC